MNLFEEHSSHYEVLELTPDATPQEIRSAYLRLKSAYGKDNIAHYTLFSREETESMLQKIESAYIILSNPEKRRAYDQAQGLSQVSGNAFGPDAGGGMAFTPNDFAAGGYGLNTSGASFDSLDPIATAGTGFPTSGTVHATHTHPVTPVPVHTSTTIGSHAPQQHRATAASLPPIAGVPDLESMIQNEQEWSGAFFRKVREAKRMTLEDLSDYTRISRIYLNAIEEEDFKKLPASVYVRGFLQQMAKRLKLPVDVAVSKYLERFKSATS